MSETSDLNKKIKELEQEHSVYKDLFDNANDIIYTHDLAGNFIDVNKAGLSAFRYHNIEMTKINIKQIVDPEYLRIAQEKIKEKLERGIPTLNYTLLCHRRGGEPIWLEVSSRLLFKNGRPYGVHGVARDVSKRNIIEAKLKNYIDRYKTYFYESNDAGLIINKRKSTIDECTNRALEILRYLREDLIGLHYTKLFNPEKVLFYANRFRKIVKQGGTFRFKADLLTKNKNIVKTEICSNVIKAGRRDVIQLIIRKI